uniref:serine/threonine-protein kinase n=1 Tax=Paractinoplanes polyasparticus TaxID=2856853 RepID=UPI001C865922|nr:serine/threonine-protein kinase [Actinoplanes polyasparticus]
MEPLRSGDPAYIGRYELESRLGSGGMGTVYLGRTPGGRPAAVKVLNPLGEWEPETVQRFQREVETLGRVRSAYSAALIDFDLTGRPFWMATEYIPGPTLSKVIARDGAIPPAECLQLMAALAEGIGDIHAHGIFHRDVKPQNIILSPTGPRLIDFGIARGPAQSRLTETGLTMGTPHYVAPELFEDGDLTPAADLFGLGATIAFAATGRQPYGKGTMESVFKRVCFEEIDCDGVDRTWPL